jgi:hypothetical protein
MGGAKGLGTLGTNPSRVVGSKNTFPGVGETGPEAVRRRPVGG